MNDTGKDFPKVVDYASITTRDRNPFKRKLQNLRLKHSCKVLFENETSEFSGNILDYGAGNAELSRRLAILYPLTTIFSYEPASGYREQAANNVKNYENVSIVTDITEIKTIHFDYIFCLEVFEHLEQEKIVESLVWFNRLLKSNGKLVIGIPIELYLPALIKGLFRMTRRFGEVDARPGNILKALFGVPPKNRTVIEIEKGIPYITRHMGFDYHDLDKLLSNYFYVKKMYGSPIPILPIVLNFEKYYVCHKHSNAKVVK